MLPAKAFALPFPVPPTPSWRELASNVYAKFASYLLRDPATRLQGGRTGSDSEHRQRVTSTGTNHPSPWPGFRFHWTLHIFARPLSLLFPRRTAPRPRALHPSTDPRLPPAFLLLVRAPLLYLMKVEHVCETVMAEDLAL